MVSLRHDRASQKSFARLARGHIIAFLVNKPSISSLAPYRGKTCLDSGLPQFNVRDKWSQTSQGISSVRRNIGRRSSVLSQTPRLPQHPIDLLSNRSLDFCAQRCSTADGASKLSKLILHRWMLGYSHPDRWYGKHSRDLQSSTIPYEIFEVETRHPVNDVSLEHRVYEVALDASDVRCGEMPQRPALPTIPLPLIRGWPCKR